MDFTEYEQFVAELQIAVFKADELTKNLRTLKFERNKKIGNKYGVKREFDVYWEYELDGRIYRTVIECKNYESPITVEKIDALTTKVCDIEAPLVPIFATKTGYQSGAKSAGKYHNIELLIAREQNISDWTDENGQPLIRIVRINGHYSGPANIHDFVPDLDADWIREHTDIDTSQPVNLSGMNNELMIEDEKNGEQYSVHDLASRLAAPPGQSYGRFTENKKFENGYFHPPEIW